ncbi:WD40-repeat-containing domain protein [Thamnidium elegans]|nr:WD40-repeat-containing domain protein [Thamnidium elegans]
MQITVPANKIQMTKNASTINPIRNNELVRLMLQSLIDLGYNEAAETLQLESGIPLESEIAGSFRTCILQGQWQTSETLLQKIPFISSNPESDLLKVQFLIRQQKYLELLEQGETMQALHVLRSEITPLGQNTERLHQLTSLVLCSSVEDVKKQAQWDGIEGNSRELLLEQVQAYIDPSAMLPNQRLMILLDQALEWQKRACLYHNPRQDIELSLFSDHICDKDLFPTTTIKILIGHVDEIWHVSYSHDGQYLASVSKDKTCIVWDMKTLSQLRSFKGEVSGSYCAWSPDDSKLLICGTDFSLRLWDPFNGALLHTFTHHEDQVTSCVWLPDNQHFISGACDTELCLWDIDKVDPVTLWQVPRTTDMKITEDGTKLLTISIDKCITMYDVDGLTITETAKIQEEGTITSLTVTKDGRFALVNVQDVQELHLWDLTKLQLVRKYSGQRQLAYIIRSTLGGHNESFVLSGSEDNRVYIWSRENETLLETLEGHDNTVNCVSWCPVEPMQFVSASDDHTIRVWGSQSSMIP